MKFGSPASASIRSAGVASAGNRGGAAAVAAGARACIALGIASAVVALPHPRAIERCHSETLP
jgi:hypothetical protein